MEKSKNMIYIIANFKKIILTQNFMLIPMQKSILIVVNKPLKKNKKSLYFVKLSCLKSITFILTFILKYLHLFFIENFLEIIF